MTSNDRVSVSMSRRECWMMKDLLNMVADKMIQDRYARSYKMLDLCSKLNKRIEDALQEG